MTEELHLKHFVNADLIAKGLSPFDPSLADIQAGRIMVEKMDQLRTVRESFAIETTLASKSIANFVAGCKMKGYKTRLIFVSLPDPETALARVALRVVMGGHDIPPETVRRRFYRGLRNLFDVYCVPNEERAKGLPERSDESPETAKVESRAKVPFFRGEQNMAIVDRWTILDNSREERQIIAESIGPSERLIYDSDAYQNLQKMTRHAE